MGLLCFRRYLHLSPAAMFGACDLEGALWTRDRVVTGCLSTLNQHIQHVGVISCTFHILSHPFTSFHIFYLTGSLGSCIFSSILVSPPCWASRSLVFSSVSQAHQCGKSKLVPVGVDQTIFACPASTNSAITPILSQHYSNPYES